MVFRSSLEEQCYRILERKGGRIADRARTILLEERSLDGLRNPLQYISEVWRDLLTPSLVILSCEALGEKPGEATHQASLAISLMNLTFRLWDDIVDKTRYTRFVPTVPGKFGEGITLIIGGLACAKAFSILAEMEVSESKRQTITKLIWDYWKRLARAETMNLELRKRNDVKPEEKLRVFRMEGINLETSMKIGATLGNGSRDEIRQLGNYGRYLGTILELRKDLNVSFNLTLELAEKIRRGTLPYVLLLARDRSKKIREHLPLLRNNIKPSHIKEIVEAVLETGALEDTVRLLEKIARKAEVELSELNRTKPTRTLKFLLEAQVEPFVENLSAGNSE